MARKRARKANKSHGHGVLQQGNGGRKRTYQRQHSKRRTGRQKLVEPERRKHGEVEHRHTRALQRQRVGQLVGLTGGQVAAGPPQGDFAP